MKKIIKRVISVLLIIVILVTFAGGNYLVDYAIKRKSESIDVSPTSTVTSTNQTKIEENVEMLTNQTNEWLSDVNKEEVSIESDDQLKLAGTIYSSNESNKWVIVVHGYQGSQDDMLNIACQYAKMNYNVLAIDNRSHGKSEGTYIGMGWLDRKDLVKWINYIVDKDNKSKIILHGVSMGAATVMMTSGEDLPENVIGIVEDCGYTSVWDIFSDELSYLFHLPEFPLLYSANLISNIKAGYDFNKASSLKQISKSDIPMLFIHGSIDTFVKTDMVYQLYDSYNGKKDILVVDGAGHGQSYKLEPELYFNKVFTFIDGIEQ
jgi:fermentation-respiration switch protein FrsA (DUF1100 family)